MSRRAVALAALLVLLALVPAGAFSGVFASGTTDSGLVIQAADGPNGEYADFSSGHLALDFTADGGLSENAINRFDAVFTVTNDRSYAAPVWIDDSSDAISFYNTSSGASVEGRDDGPSLEPGETLVVGVSVDTREASVEQVESTDNFSVETLVEEATATATATPTATATASSGADTTSTATATATATSSGSSGGGGQSGGSTTESSYTVYDTNTGSTVNVQEGVSSDPVTASLHGDGTAYVSGDGTTVDAAAMTLTFDRSNWRVELTDPTDSPQNAPAVGSGEPVSYFRFDAYNVEASAFDSVAVNLTLSSLPAGTDPSQVTVYRHTADGWQSVETTHLGGDRYRAKTGGFGELAVVVEDGSGSTSGTEAGTEGSIDSTATATETATATAADTAVAEPGNTPTATAVDRFEDPLPLRSGLGPATLFVFGLFTVWLGVRARVDRNGPGGL